MISYFNFAVHKVTFSNLVIEIAMDCCNRGKNVLEKKIETRLHTFLNHLGLGL